MPKRSEEKQPERIARLENLGDQIGMLATPKVDDTEAYEDTITRNQVLSNYRRETDPPLLVTAHLLHGRCISQGKVLQETARYINSTIQFYSTILRGIDGKTSEEITTYTVKQTIKKEVKGEAKNRQFLGKEG